MTQEEIYTLIAELARLDEMVGPANGPWRHTLEEDLYRQVSYEGGYVTFLSDTGMDVVSTTERFTPETKVDAMVEWIRIRNTHMAELLALFHRLQEMAGKSSLPN